MGYAFVWLFMAIICAIIGAKRKIGGVAGFFLGLFLSVIGLIIVLCSKSLDDEARQLAIMQNMTQKPAQPKSSTADELQKLASLHATNAISDEEYEQLKAKVIN